MHLACVIDIYGWFALHSPVTYHDVMMCIFSQSSTFSVSLLQAAKKSDSVRLSRFLLKASEGKDVMLAWLETEVCSNLMML
jgi:hypothetical protein